MKTSKCNNVSLIESDNCVGCFLCSFVCPTQCIHMSFDELGFSHPKIDDKSCLNCGLCLSKCPINQHKNHDCPIGETAFGFSNDDSEFLKQSSSGGFFSYLANEMVKKEKAKVFGAAFVDKTDLRMICADNDISLKPLFGSKYVQASLHDAFSSLRDSLNNGDIVLFCGTPCQVAAITSLFGNEPPSNLFLIDFICHGVSSPTIFKDYIKTKEIQNGPVSQIKFRYKQESWASYGMLIKYENGEEIFESKNDNYVYKAFLSNYSLRESCFNCCFKGKNRFSDITIGDYWGVEKIYPNSDCKRGLSIVIPNTIKGNNLIKKYGVNHDFLKTDIATVARFNSSYIAPVKKPRNYGRFIKEFNKSSFEKAIDKYCRENRLITFLRVLKRKILK